MNKSILSVGQHQEKALLSKAQKEFNRLTKRIAKLRTELEQFEEASVRLRQRSATALFPIIQKYQERRADLVHLFDRAYRSGNFKKREQKKLEHLIIQMAFELIAEHEMEDLKPIYDQYNSIPFDEEMAAMDDDASEVVKAMMEQMFGFGIDDDADLSTPEKMQAYFEAQMADEAAAEQTRWRQQEERQAKRPKTAKQLEKEQQKAEEERKISKSVREVYLDLVKAFHPDLETDDTEKQRKTEIMQRVTAAYEKNDLLTLLQLQLEFERIDQDHLENIAEDRLKHFNKILQRQAAELNDTLYDVQLSVSELLQQTVLVTNPLYLEQLLEREIRRWKKQLREVEGELQHFMDPVYLKAWLKEYRVPKAGEENWEMDF